MQVDGAGTQAVVLGAGLAGLTAAKALSAHFDLVVVVERDSWEGEGLENRPGVPQFQQPHVLLARGLQVRCGGRRCALTLFLF